MYARYLEAVALALRGHVRQQLDGKAANIVDECVSTLAALANALETGDAAAADAVASWLRAGPVESPGVHRDNADAHAALVTQIGKTLTIDDPNVRAALGREHSLGQAAMDRMLTLMAHPAASASDGKTGIDPVRLEAFLRQETGDGTLTVTDFRQVLGGRSRQTAIVQVSGNNNLPAELVVQRQTPGMENLFAGTAVEVEVMRTLRQAGMAVPNILFMATDCAILGASFMVMERAPGTPAQREFWDMPASTDQAEAMARQMAILHSHAPGKLADILPRPRAGGGSAGWREEAERLGERLLTRTHGPSVTLAAAIAWLRDHADGIDDVETIVHNDFMFHNILVENGEITAVLDWEQVALGHPAEDLGYVYPVVSTLGVWDRFLAAYRDAGGIDVSQRAIDFFALRAILRLMGMVFDGRTAFESGATEEIVIAGAGAGFVQRLHHRLADVLAGVLARG
jgi:aminoglycoside phosphotransferase (APT) family kinase protein